MFHDSLVHDSLVHDSLVHDSLLHDSLSSLLDELDTLKDTRTSDIGQNNWEEYTYEYGKWYLLACTTDGKRVYQSVDTLLMALHRSNLLDRVSEFYKISDELRINGIPDHIKFLREKLVESCFVIELFRRYAMQELRDPKDPIFNLPESLHEVRRDLISQHNKFPPFFVLVEFFNATKILDDPRDNLIDLALLFFENWVGHPLKPSPNNPIQICEIEDLVDLVHKALSVPVPAETSITIETDIELQYINYATELQEAGVKFKRMEGNNLDIKFRNGVLEIPPIKVAESTTLFLLQKLMEYESYRFPGSARRNVNDYVKFIQCLINSPNDVELLRRSGIIENCLGNDQLIFDKLIKLGNESKISRNFTYSGIFTEVNEHCRHPRNVWMATLWRNYFNSPWSFISFFAAGVLLLFTLTQTLFSILSYHPS